VGVTETTAEFLIEARGQGVDFDKTVTVGRQTLAFGPRRLKQLLRRHGRLPTRADERDLLREFREAPWVIDPLLRVLGAGSIDAIDISRFEGATLTHDLNDPLPKELEGRFDLVFDGGSLEHIFNVPMALRNYMRMPRVGGRLIIVAPANNYFGHGFYQFSAELFFRVFSEVNGFAVERMQIAESDLERSRPIFGARIPFEWSGGRYSVMDPQSIGDRVQLVNDQPAVLLVQARRTHLAEPLERSPQQSDYAARWIQGARDGDPLRPTIATSRYASRLSTLALMRIGLDTMPRWLTLLDPFRVRRIRGERSVANRRAYTPVSGHSPRRSLTDVLRRARRRRR
jgi:hypothetical protein